jgi:hypothetical protein
LPPRHMTMPRPPFLYTLDQIAQCIGIDDSHMRLVYIHFDTHTAGPAMKDRITARNIAPLGEKPEWRVAETELTRWFKQKGFRIRYNTLY